MNPKSNLTDEDLNRVATKVSDLLVENDKKIDDKMNEKLDLYYEYYQRTSKLVNFAIFVTVAVFAMSLMLYVKIVMFHS
jgi:pantothenate kinase-related protein Tda10